MPLMSPFANKNSENTGYIDIRNKRSNMTFVLYSNISHNLLKSHRMHKSTITTKGNRKKTPHSSQKSTSANTSIIFL